MAKRSKKRCEELPILHPDAAGIDVGASDLFVAVSADRDPQPVRSFPAFTRDLNALADWLQQCGVRSVAMESTSVYWIPVYQILESRGLEVCLVNAQHVKNVPGRKTDVSDCQWLQYLHSVGLLRASFRPPGFICVIRSLWRHRSSLIQMAAEHVLHMQKALDQMNLQIHRVLNDITGLSGLRILDAILAPLHLGWDSVLRIRSAVARCSIPRVAASGAALPLRCAWPRTRCITQKIILASSFGGSLGSSANPKPSPPRLTNWLELCITCSALKRLTTKPSFTAATKKL